MSVNIELLSIKPPVRDTIFGTYIIADIDSTLIVFQICPVNLICKHLVTFLHLELKYQFKKVVMSPLFASNEFSAGDLDIPVDRRGGGGGNLEDPDAPKVIEAPRLLEERPLGFIKSSDTCIYPNTFYSLLMKASKRSYDLNMEKGFLSPKERGNGVNKKHDLSTDDPPKNKNNVIKDTTSSLNVVMSLNQNSGSIPGSKMEQLVDLKNLLDRDSSCNSLFSLPKRLKANNTIRVKQLVTILLIESSIHLLDQNQYPVDTSLIHIESRKSPTAVLFDVDTGKIPIRHCEMLKNFTPNVLARYQG
nr:hypothetical protein [Tanacetum cinerariifolium]